MADLKNNKDALAGALLFGFGALGMYLALGYPFGSSLRMGPGFFPRMLSGILMGFGALITFRGLRSGVKVSGRWGWKPLVFLVASLLAFGFLMERFGLVPALIVMFFVAAFGGHEFKLVEVAVLALVMTIFAVVVFVYALGLPYPLLGRS